MEHVSGGCAIMPKLCCFQGEGYVINGSIQSSDRYKELWTKKS